MTAGRPLLEKYRLSWYSGVRLNQFDYEQLDSLAQERGESKNSLIRKAVREFLKKEKKAG